LPGATSLRTNLPKHDDAAHASWFGCWRIEAELVGKDPMGMPARQRAVSRPASLDHGNWAFGCDQRRSG
jgi:hypothetical protein